jgi:hypothetical protein
MKAKCLVSDAVYDYRPNCNILHAVHATHLAFAMPADISSHTQPHCEVDLPMHILRWGNSQLCLHANVLQINGCTKQTQAIIQHQGMGKCALISM